MVSRPSAVPNPSSNVLVAALCLSISAAVNARWVPFWNTLQLPQLLSHRSSSRLQVFFSLSVICLIPKTYRIFTNATGVSANPVYMRLNSKQTLFILPPCVPELHNVVQRTREQLILMGRWPLHRCHPARVRRQGQENQGAICTEKEEKKTSADANWNQYFWDGYKVWEKQSVTYLCSNVSSTTNFNFKNQSELWRKQTKVYATQVWGGEEPNQRNPNLENVFPSHYIVFPKIFFKKANKKLLLLLTYKNTGKLWIRFLEGKQITHV